MAENNNPLVFLDVSVDGDSFERMYFELFSDVVPSTAENFRALCTGEKGVGPKLGKPLHYKGTFFHRIVKGHTAQGGGFLGQDGLAGESIYGVNFPAESSGIMHDKPGLLTMSTADRDRRGSIFNLTFSPTHDLDSKSIVFGTLVRGNHVLEKIENAQVKGGDTPAVTVKIVNCGEISGSDKKELRHLLQSSTLLEFEILEKLKSFPQPSEGSIYKVPEFLRAVNEEAYRPLVISIGPYHYGDRRLASLEAEKLRYLKSFLEKVHLGSCLKVITEREDEIRSSYVEAFELSSKNFIKMVLVDSAFIIEILLMHNLEKVEGADKIFHKPGSIGEVKRDLTLVENQLPFSIIKELYYRAFPNRSCVPFTVLVYKFFIQKEWNPYWSLPSEKFEHFTDFLRFYYKPVYPRPTGKYYFKFACSAKALSAGGVRFAARKNLHASFVGGVLTLPRLRIYDHTESFYRNLVAYEQFHYFEDSYIIDFFGLMGGLVNTSEDVQILVKSGVIENWVGSHEEVVIFFNKMVKHVDLNGENYYYSDICTQIDEYRRTRWHQWMTVLRQDYFQHPWSAIAVVAAIAAYIIHVIGTVCSCRT